MQAQAQSDTEPFDPASGSLPDLRKAAEDLKTKIAEAKSRNDMPLDSALGNPGWEQRAADGRLDVPDEDDEFYRAFQVELGRMRFRGHDSDASRRSLSETPCHSRASGNPESRQSLRLDARFRGHDSEQPRSWIRARLPSCASRNELRRARLGR